MPNSPNWPACGRFMILLLRSKPELPGAYVWACTNQDCVDREPMLPAPECDWLYCGIPDEELKVLRGEEPETYDTFTRMRQAFQSRPYKNA